MHDQIEIVTLESRPALAIPALAKTLQMGKVMGNAYGKIKARVNAHELASEDDKMPFCIYRNLDWDLLEQKGPVATIKMLFTHRWKFDMGMPVARKPDDAGDADGDGMRSIDIPAGRYIKAIHMGPYMKVGEAYTRIRAFAAGQDLNFRDYSIEVYANDPTEVAKQDIRTEVCVPIA